MHGIFLIDALAGVALALLWYLVFVRYNRRHAMRVIHRLRSAFSGHAQIMAVRWNGASRFAIRLRVVSTLFQQASVRVQMLPRELPVQWLWSRLRKRQET